MRAYALGAAILGLLTGGCMTMPVGGFSRAKISSDASPAVTARDIKQKMEPIAPGAAWAAADRTPQSAKVPQAGPALSASPLAANSAAKETAPGPQARNATSLIPPAAGKPETVASTPKPDPFRALAAKDAPTPNKPGADDPPPPPGMPKSAAAASKPAVKVVPPSFQAASAVDWGPSKPTTKGAESAGAKSDAKVPAKTLAAGLAEKDLQRIGGKISDAAGPFGPFEFTVLRNPRPQVMRTSGKKIVVSTGMLDRVSSEAELAGILAFQVAEKMLSATGSAKKAALAAGQKLGAAPDASLAERELPQLEPEHIDAVANGFLEQAGFRNLDLPNLRKRLVAWESGRDPSVAPTSMLGN
ncbi:MAG TPA: hypothetical protein VNC50_03320 [Planctomycetia bacterium]|nr:hypothetical protein [Planctomycetia bacterium]